MMLPAQLKEAFMADAEERTRIIRALAEAAKQSAAASDELLDVLVADQDLAEMAALVFAAMGYPANGPAILALLFHVSNANSPAASAALDALRTIPALAVAPYAIETLWDRGASNAWWSNDVQGLCYALGQLGAAYARPCWPIILYLLSDRTTRNTLYLPAVLAALAGAGPEDAVYVLPALIAISQEQAGTAIGAQALRLMEAFDASVLATYARIITPHQQ